MNDAQRKVVLASSLLVAPLLLLGGFWSNNPLVALGGPVIALGIGLYFWFGREKRGAAAGREAPPIQKRARLALVACAAFFAGAVLTFIVLLDDEIRDAAYSADGTPSLTEPVSGPDLGARSEFENEEERRAKDRAAELQARLDTLSEPSCGT